VTVCPAHSAVPMEPICLTCCAVATPMDVRIPAVASVLDVTIPLPLQFPPLRPERINPVTPVYALPVHEPTDVVVISALAPRSIFPAPTTVTAPVFITMEAASVERKRRT